MYKTFKFRLYPNKKQETLLNKSFGCSRFIYNLYLSNIKSNGYRNAYLNISDYVNNLKYEYLFLQEADSAIIRKTLFHLDDNIGKYYNNGFGYPKYIGNKELSRKISDASFYEIIRQLQYKSKYKNKYFYQIDTYYPSSQECSVCGNIDRKYKNLAEITSS